MMNKLLIALLCFTMISCIHIDERFKGLPNGQWQGILHLNGKINELVPFERQNYKKQDVYKYKRGKYDLPFLFEVKHLNKDDIQIIIHNGEERITLDDISYGTVRSTAKDTFRINFPLYNSYITAVYEDGILEGNWHVPDKGDYKIPFVARFGKSKRFDIIDKETNYDLTGRWKVRFDINEDEITPAIGDFVQNGHTITGTFMTETGDYRYLEGVVEGNKIIMSTFDGSHAFLFRAHIKDDGSLKGVFKSGTHYTTQWDAIRDEDFTLSNPDSLTMLVPNAPPLEFSFIQLNGDTLKYSDIAFKKAPLIIQIMGTWCPNCRDESLFLKNYIFNHDISDLNIIGVAYERSKDTQKALDHLSKYHNQLDLPYPMVLGGIPKKEEVLADFPQLDKMMSYPTMIFIDREGNIKHIHTGFAGPATAEYKPFKASFHQKVQELIFGN